MIGIKRTLFLSSLFPITVFLPFKFNRDCFQEEGRQRGKMHRKGEMVVVVQPSQLRLSE